MSTLARRSITIPLYFLMFAFSLVTLPFLLPVAVVADLALRTRFGFRQMARS